MHTYTHAYIHTCIHTHTHIHTHAHTRAHARTHTHTCKAPNSTSRYVPAARLLLTRILARLSACHRKTNPCLLRLTRTFLRFCQNLSQCASGMPLAGDIPQRSAMQAEAECSHPTSRTSAQNSRSVLNRQRSSAYPHSRRGEAVRGQKGHTATSRTP